MKPFQAMQPYLLSLLIEYFIYSTNLTIKDILHHNISYILVFQYYLNHRFLFNFSNVYTLFLQLWKLSEERSGANEENCL